MAHTNLDFLCPGGTVLSVSELHWTSDEMCALPLIANPNESCRWTVSLTVACERTEWSEPLPEPAGLAPLVVLVLVLAAMARRRR